MYESEREREKLSNSSSTTIQPKVNEWLNKKKCLTTTTTSVQQVPMFIDDDLVEFLANIHQGGGRVGQYQMDPLLL